MGWKFYTPAVNPSIGTALPSNPVDGQEFTLVDSLSAPTYSWRLRYVAAKSTNKWVFVGGTPIVSEVATGETTSSTAYTNLSTTGPSITVPIAGKYKVEIGALIYNVPTANSTGIMSYAIGATAAADADSIQMLIQYATANANQGGSVARAKIKDLTADTLTAKYKIVSASTGFAYRWMHLTPIAIGG